MHKLSSSLKNLAQSIGVSCTIMKLIYFVVAVLSINYNQVNGLKVLGIIPFPSKSHFAIGNGIIESLVDAGHEVTVMSPYPQRKNRPNYNEIDVSKILEIFESGK